MHLTVLGLILIDSVFLGIALVTGLQMFMGTPRALPPHLVWGLCAILFTCMIHCMAMFYFVGTGKDIQIGIKEHPDLQEKYLNRLRAFKLKVHPNATFSILTLIAAGILGGAAHYRMAPGWLHFGVIAIALVWNAVAFFHEFACLRDNRRIIIEVGQTLYDRGVRV